MMHNPPHPGKIVKKSLIDSTGLSVTEAANVLGVGRVALSRLINGHTGISAEMAVRLSIALKTSSKMWLSMQDNYDLWQITSTKMKALTKEVSVLRSA